MLADISGSTALYEQIGNVEALKRVSVCLDLLRYVIEARGGVFISSKGDDVLCTFEDPHAALEVAIEMFQTIQQNSLFIHAGVDFGPVIRARDDVFGDTVNMASRLSSLANAGEVLCSQALYERLGQAHKSMVRFFGTRQFKGMAEPSNIYLFSDALPGQSTEIVFTQKPGRYLEEALDAMSNSARAVLRLGEEAFVCSRGKPVSMGRSPDCDLVVPQPWVSRSHAFLEVRQSNVYLSDNSSSGTYVCFDGRPPLHVTRETLMLPDSCTLSLAKHPSDPGAQIIACDVLAVQAEEET